MVLPSVKAGRVRALGVTSLKRTSLAPELPSIAEFVPGYEVIGWYGLLAPAKTPGDIIAKLNGELTKALASTELQDRLSGMGAVALGTTADDFARHICDEISKMRKAIKLSGARAE
jgi:tripartite-type tricarboxylate transporter receptor subunit TctC